MISKIMYKSGINGGYEKDNDYATSLVDLPTELLVEILSYLSIRDRIVMRYVSRRFRDVGETPLLWKEFASLARLRTSSLNQCK